MGFCSLQHNRLKKSYCDYQLNKVKYIYLVSINDIGTFTVSEGGDCGSELTAFKTKGDLPAIALIEPNEASYTDTLMINDNGTKYKQHQLNFSIGGQYDAEAVCDVDALALGEYVAFVKMTNGNQVCLGNSIVGLSASSVVTTQPSTPSEFNGITIEMTCDVLHSVVPISTSVMDYIENHLIVSDKSIYKVIANGEDGQIIYYAPMGIVESNAFGQTSKINNIEIVGSGVTELADNAFYALSNLNYVYLNKGIKKIGAEAFGADLRLSKVYYRGNAEELSEVFVDDNAFGNSPMKCIETVEDSDEICYGD